MIATGECLPLKGFECGFESHRGHPQKLVLTSGGGDAITAAALASPLRMTDHPVAMTVLVGPAPHRPGTGVPLGVGLHRP